MKIGIIGAGTMGAGIAQTFAMHEGYEVILSATSAASAERGKGRVQSALNKLVARGKLDQNNADAAVARISAGLIDKFEDCDLVIESVLEQMELKKTLFRQIQAICKEHTMFASNTSSLSITELSFGLDRPVVGMHFFNPAPVMKLVEVVSGLTTPPELIEKVSEVAADIGKTPIVVKDSAGFVVNRILIPMINEAASVLAENAASAEDIDTAMKLGANHPMGPLALGDLIGLDVCLAIMEVLYGETGDPKYRAHSLLRQMVRGGLLGRKSGQGFFRY